MVMIARIELPLPPSVNRLWGERRGGSKYLMPAQRYYRQLAGALMVPRPRPRVIRPGESFVAEREIDPEERYSVRIELTPRDNRRWDIDNRVKPVLDALEYGGVIRDDAAVDRLEVIRLEPPRPPGGARVEVALRRPVATATRPLESPRDRPENRKALSRKPLAILRFSRTP